MATAPIYSANVTSVTINEKDAPGLQAIEYKVVRNRQNIHTIGTDERQAVLFGSLYVTGVLTFRSTCPYLDELVEMEIAGYETQSFQIVVKMKGRGEELTTLVFDGCDVEDKSFRIDASGIGVTDYTFTATRVREEK